MYTIVHHNLDQTTAEEGKDFWLSQKSIQEYYNTYPFKQIRFVCERNGNNDYPRMDFATPLSRADDAINYFVKRDSNNQPITSARIKSCDIEVFELIVHCAIFCLLSMKNEMGKMLILWSLILALQLYTLHIYIFTRRDWSIFPARLDSDVKSKMLIFVEFVEL